MMSKEERRQKLIELGEKAGGKHLGSVGKFGGGVFGAAALPRLVEELKARQREADGTASSGPAAEETAGGDFSGLKSVDESEEPDPSVDHSRGHGAVGTGEDGTR